VFSWQCSVFRAGLLEPLVDEASSERGFRGWVADLCCKPNHTTQSVLICLNQCPLKKITGHRPTSQWTHLRAKQIQSTSSFEHRLRLIYTDFPLQGISTAKGTKLAKAASAMKRCSTTEFTGFTERTEWSPAGSHWSWGIGQGGGTDETNRSFQLAVFSFQSWTVGALG